MTDRNANLNCRKEDARNSESSQNEFHLQEPRQPDVMRARITTAGYTIFDNGTGSGWYALLPGETSFFDNFDEVEEDPDVTHRQNYLGFFGSELELLEELTDMLDEQKELNEVSGSGVNEFTPRGESLLISSFYKSNLTADESSLFSFVLNVRTKEFLDAKVSSGGKWMVVDELTKDALLKDILKSNLMSDPFSNGAYLSDNLPLWINEIEIVQEHCPFTTIKRDSLGTHVSFTADETSEVDDIFLKNTIRAAIALAKFEHTQIVYELAGVSMFVVESDSVDVQSALCRQRAEHLKPTDIVVERQR